MVGREMENEVFTRATHTGGSPQQNMKDLPPQGQGGTIAIPAASSGPQTPDTPCLRITAVRTGNYFSRLQTTAGTRDFFYLHEHSFGKNPSAGALHF